MLWFNDDIDHDGRMLLFRNWIRSNILYVGDLVTMQSNFLNTVNRFQDKLVNLDDNGYQSMQFLLHHYKRNGRKN